MTDVKIEIGQRWQSKHPGDQGRVVVVDTWDGIEAGHVGLRNEQTDRNTRIRPAVLRKHYRLLPEEAPGG